MKNCYVLGLSDDSLEAISDLRRDMARTYAMGGGVGIDLTCLRPAGAPVKNCAITSSGAASFADGFSHLTEPDRKAIAAYVKSLKPVHNKVESRP